MSVVQVELEGGSLELNLNSEKAFYITKQVHDLRNLNTRNASFSKSITIPRSQQNVSLLGRQMVEFGGSTTDKYKFLTCQVYMGGFPVLLNAKLFVESQAVTGKTITVRIFGGVLDFFEGLTDEPLSALDFSEYNFEWNLTNIQNHVNTTEGFLFGQSIWFQNKEWQSAQASGIDPSINFSGPDIRTSGGFMYFKTIVEKILALQDGLLFDFTALTDIDLYNKMVLVLPITQLTDNFTAVDGFTGFVEQPGAVQGIDPDTTYRALFPDVQQDEPTGFWDAINSEYVITSPSFYDIETTLDLTGIFTNTPNATFVGKVKLYLEGTVLKTWSIYEGSSRSLNYSTSRYINLNEKVFIEFEGKVGGGANAGWTYVGNLDVKGSSAIKNDFVNISNWMPDISQRDFMREVFKFFHAVPSFENGVVKISLWDEIPDEEEIDLTEYVDVSKEINVTGELPGYAQKNIFEYTNHETVTRLGTDYDFEMLNESLSVKKTVIKSIFSASDQSLAASSLLGSFPLLPMEYNNIVGNDITVTAASDLYSTPTKNDLKVGDLLFIRDTAGTAFQGRYRVIAIQSETAGQIDVVATQTSTHPWEWVRNKTQEMGLRIGETIQSTSVTVRDGGSSVVVPNIKAVVFTENLIWPTLAEEYYNNLVSMLTKPDVAQIWLRLPNSVFNSLTLLKPIYFGNKKYYLNKLEQYNVDRLCRAEIIEVKSGATIPVSSSYFVSFRDEFIGYWGTAYPSVTESFFVFNNGQTQQTINIVVQGGTDATEWSVDKSVIILNSEESTTVELSFNGSVTLGNRTIDLHFENQDGLETIRPGIVDVVTVPLYSVTPTTLDYGTRTNSGNLIAIIENTGVLDIEFDLTAITGTDAAQYAFITPTPSGLFTVQPGQTQDIRVRFTQNGIVGVKTAEFTVDTSTTPGAINTLVNLTTDEI